jgi:hypothetical protein
MKKVSSSNPSWRFRKKKPKQINLVKAGWLLKTKYTPVNKLIKKLDVIFSTYKRLSALSPQGYIRCFTCGAFLTFRMADCGHYIGRENMSTRFEEKNTECQCHSCNRYAEGKKDIFAINLQKKYGAGILEWLNQKKGEIKQFTASELEDLISKYKKLLTELKKGQIDG